MDSRRRAELLAGLGVPALAFAVAPGGSAPFSAPKGAVLCGLALGAVALVLPGPRRRLRSGPLLPALALGFLAAFSALMGEGAEPWALLLLLSACALFLALCALGLRPRALLGPLALTGAALAGVAVAQALGADPFRLFGLTPHLAGERMRVYGALGNPDFLAGFLTVTACATAAKLLAAFETRTLDTSRTLALRRAFWLAALCLQGAALLLTRSFGTVLALLAALGVLVIAPGTRRGASLALGVALLALAAAGAQGRSLRSRVEGRLYLLQVAAPHVLDAPLLGHGPGSVTARWTAWEADYWQRVHPARQLTFVAQQRHAHDDFLEIALDLGVPGLAALLAWIALALAAGLRRAKEDPATLALTCALAALAARAAVDFPLQRPAELGLFALLTASLLSTPAADLSHPAPAEEPSCPASSVPSPQRSA